MMVTVEISTIKIEGDGGKVIYLTHKGARDLQGQLNDILGPVEAESVLPGPFTVTADPYTFEWNSGTPMEFPVKIVSGPSIDIESIRCPPYP